MGTISNELHISLLHITIFLYYDQYYIKKANFRKELTNSYGIKFSWLLNKYHNHYLLSCRNIFYQNILILCYSTIFEINLSITFMIIMQFSKKIRVHERSDDLRMRNLWLGGWATQKRNITPRIHEASTAHERDGWCDERISTKRAIGIPRHKKVRHRVLDDPTSTGHAPDRSRYFIRSCDIFQAGDRRRTMGNGPPWSIERMSTHVHCNSLPWLRSKVHVRTFIILGVVKRIIIFPFNFMQKNNGFLFTTPNIF